VNECFVKTFQRRFKTIFYFSKWQQIIIYVFQQQQMSKDGVLLFLIDDISFSIIFVARLTDFLFLTFVFEENFEFNFK